MKQLDDLFSDHCTICRRRDQPVIHAELDDCLPCQLCARCLDLGNGSNSESGEEATQLLWENAATDSGYAPGSGRGLREQFRQQHGIGPAEPTRTGEICTRCLKPAGSFVRDRIGGFEISICSNCDFDLHKIDVLPPGATQDDACEQMFEIVFRNALLMQSEPAQSA